VPTFAEQGLDGLDLTTWYGLFGPANMAPELVERIARTISAGAKPATVRDKMVGDGLEPILSAPADFAKFLKADREQWLGVAKAINFKRETLVQARGFLQLAVAFQHDQAVGVFDQRDGRCRDGASGLLEHLQADSFLAP
jgi:hypothetical protein